jgi:hypothetical protein
MKKIWNFLKNHLQQDFHFKQYAVTFSFLLTCLIVNYTLDFEDRKLEPMDGYQKFFAYFLFYSIPYFTAIYIFAHFKNQKQIFSNREFWMKSLFGMFILSLDGSSPFLSTLVYGYLPSKLHLWGWKVGVNAISFFTVLLPLLIFYYFQDRKEKHVYGLNARHFDVKPYFTMLLIMVPILIAASFSDSFLRQYPMYKTSRAHVFLGVPEWMTAGVYEIAYGLDFITVEYLFRGFLVIGMMRVLGRGSVITMAVVYCVLHFGKPAGEAISSIFGGFVLGVVAYETRSVWGGVIVHMGIAWTMETVAFIQKSLMD